MDELEISGKRYISTKRAAREHGYHSDYMGQLIRGKKVAGQKVGRAWYIDEESLNAYLGKASLPAPARADTPALVAEIEQAPIAAPAQAVRTEAAQAPMQAVAPIVEPARIEHAIAQEHAPPAMPEPQARAEAAMQEPEARMPEAPAAREMQEEEPLAAAPSAEEPVVRAIYHAPYMQERESREDEVRIPIRTPMPAAHERGGLRYAPDDFVPAPAAARMRDTAPAYVPQRDLPPKSPSGFPYASLCVVAVFALLAAVFASNFISATVVSEEGKPATVNYAIHW